MSKVFVVVGLGFGDEGKGTVVDALVRKHSAGLVCRFSGGSQAAHNVVDGDRHHTFAQFGSGTFVPGVKTYLSEYCLVDPETLFPEEQHLREIGVGDAVDRLYVNGDATIVTPFHKAANRLRELARGESRHGSCGMGIGETEQDLRRGQYPLKVSQIEYRGLALIPYIRQIQQEKYFQLGREGVLSQLQAGEPEVEYLLRLLQDSKVVSDFYNTCLHFRAVLQNRIVSSAWLPQQLEQTDAVFEGAQGTLLDEDYGFHPHTTWSRTTTANARELLRGYSGHVETIGITRAYMTRHGEGPFVTEDPALEKHLPEPHNGWSKWPGAFRVGWPDLVALRYASLANRWAGLPIDSLAVTHLDRWAQLPQWKVCASYTGVQYRDQIPHVDPNAFHERSGLTERLKRRRPLYEGLGNEIITPYLESAVRAPCVLQSYGPDHRDKVWVEDRARCAA